VNANRKTWLKARARSGLGVAALTRPGWRIVSALLRDERVLARIMHQLSNRLAAEASFDQAMPEELRAIGGFEDYYWLFSSNPLNHGLSRLEHDEAAYLFRLVRSLGRPEAAEIGRFRGGSTFLLAAAGARVLSIDIDGARFESDGLRSCTRWTASVYAIELSSSSPTRARIPSSRPRSICSSSTATTPMTAFAQTSSTGGLRFGRGGTCYCTTPSSRTPIRGARSQRASTDSRGSW
jgi:hypothetical protein